MKFEVDQTRCIGCGYCAVNCPEVFNLNQEDKSYATSLEIEGEILDKALDAQANCPVDAIESIE